MMMSILTVRLLLLEDILMQCFFCNILMQCFKHNVGLLKLNLFLNTNVMLCGFQKSITIIENCVQKFTQDQADTNTRY